MNEDVQTAVIFRSEGGKFAFRIDSLLEIITRSDFTFVPGLPDCIVGVINRMGDVIPVIDLRKRLGFPTVEYSPHSCLMVIKHHSTVAAVLVDEALTSVDLENNFIELGSNSVISGIAEDADGDRVSVIDAAKFFDIK